MSGETAETTGRTPSVARPARVPYNDWTKVELPPLEEFEPSCPLSVIVPYFEAPDELERTLAALEGQSYPTDLFEVIIVDDASDPPLELPSSLLDVKLVRQEGAGFGLARARNNGVRAAAHDILVFLDADLMAEKELLAAHARWHHALSDAVTLGMYRRVSVDGVSVSMIRDRTGSISNLLGNRESDPPPLAEYVDKANNLTTKRDDLFRATSGGNLGMRRRFFDEIGGYNESFTRYGGEDTELAYRAYTHGALFVPVPEGMAWHQGRSDEHQENKQDDTAIQRGKLANLIAHKAYRRAVPGRTFMVPEYVVAVRPEGASLERIRSLVEVILGNSTHDLVVRIEARGRENDDLAWLASHFQGDGRVCFAGVQSALDQFPSSPFHVSVEAGAVISRDLIRSLRGGLGSGVVGEDPSALGTRVSITRAWALRRAQRTGLDVEDFGDVVMVDLRSRTTKMRLRFRRARQLLRAAPYRKGWRDVLRRASLTRPRDLVGFFRWLLHGLGTRLSEIVRREPQRSGYSPPRSPAWKAPAPLGVEVVALGARAGRVLSGCPSVTARLSGRHLDFVVADTPAEAESCAAPAIILTKERNLAVPAFDPTIDNPVGWKRDVDYLVGSLGPRRLLPPGIKAHREVGSDDKAAVRLCHHLVDTAAFHADEIERAGMLVRLAATGVPVYLVDGGRGLEVLIGNELHALMTSGVPEADADERESFSIEMRRIALRDHSFRSRARQMGVVVLDDPPDVPAVSILLATKRPDHLDWAVGNVARQSYPRLQLVLALHGGEFETAAVERVVERLQMPARVVRVGGGHTLGAVLNAAVKEATGVLLAKMDDDDLYGPDHIWDLVLAHEYSGAEIVGKPLETVYLADRNQTVRQYRLQGETFNRHVLGATLLISRHDLDRVGGWQRVRSREDVALVAGVLRNGGGVYRTHGSGCLVIRHGEQHTWMADDGEFLSRAYDVLPGWRPDAAGIDGPELPNSFGRRK